MVIIIRITSNWPPYESEDLDEDPKKALMLLSGSEVEVATRGPGGYLVSLAKISDALREMGLNNDADTLLAAYGTLGFPIITSMTRVPVPKWAAIEVAPQANEGKRRASQLIKVICEKCGAEISISEKEKDEKKTFYCLGCKDFFFQVNADGTITKFHYGREE